MPLYLSEADVEALLTPGEAVPVIEESFRRLAAGDVENVPRRRLALEEGSFAVMSAVDRGLGFAGVKSYAVVAGKASFAVCLFELEAGSLAGVLEADALGQRRTGAASGVAAKHLARPGARSLGVIGCGWQAEAQVDAIRAAVPTIERVVAYCRTPETLEAFCATTDAEAGESPSDAAAQDIVVTATTSRDPVLRGEWLREGALVCAIGANRPRRAGAGQRRARASHLRLLRLARAGDARVGRSDRARRRRRARLARGARAARGRRGRAARPRSRTRTSPSSSRTGSRRGTSRSPPRRSRALASAASGGSSSRPRGSRAPRAWRSTVSSPIALMTSGRSSSRARCSGLSRFWTYRSSRICARSRPRSCSRITYEATRSSADERWKRKEKRFRNAIAGDCILRTCVGMVRRGAARSGCSAASTTRAATSGS